MKAEELMIGDWIKLQSKFGEMISRVSCIDKTSFGDYIGIEGKAISEKSENIYPVPLTSEILEKNGFVPSDEWKSLYYLNDGEDEFAFEINNAYQIWWSKECGNVMIAKLEYVHTLQHALKLCGIDKEIVLLT